MADKYDTKLSDKDETEFQAWAEKNGRTQDTDYDMRGWWKENGDKPAPAEGQHFTDKFKKPNHPTFSDESQYSGKDGNVGGKWTDKGKGRWGFRPSKTNLKNMSREELQKYFSEREPDSDLDLPKSTRAQRRYGGSTPEE